MRAQRGRRSLYALSTLLEDTICFPFMAGWFSSAISKTPLWIKYALMALQRSLFDHLVERKITGNSPENRKSCQDTAINILLLLFRLLGFSLGSGSSLLPGTEDSALGRTNVEPLHSFLPVCSDPHKLFSALIAVLQPFYHFFSSLTHASVPSVSQ